MSYILDALRKSDQERQREAAPVLRSVHAEFNRPGFDPPRMLLRICGVVILLAVLLGALWLGTQRGASWLSDSSEAPEESPVVVAEAVPAVAVPQPAPEPVMVAPPAAVQLLEIWQLSEAEQRFLQALDISLHVYSPEPAQRTVIINGLRVREGQPLGQDLSLLEITSDGIIVDFQQQRVHLATVGKP